LTTRIALRDVIEGDLAALFEHQADPEATRMAAFPARGWDAFMAHWAAILRDPTVVAKAILVDGRLAGNVVCFVQSGRRLVGYWIGRSDWGRGVATAALAALLREVGERPLFAYVVTHNAASIRVLEKCGFRPCRAEGERPVPPLDHGDGVREVLYELSAPRRG
jgi:RimJ/RimL family protein N-acetyltransferase